MKTHGYYEYRPTAAEKRQMLKERRECRTKDIQEFLESILQAEQSRLDSIALLQSDDVNPVTKASILASLITLSEQQTKATVTILSGFRSREYVLE